MLFDFKLKRQVRTPPVYEFRHKGHKVVVRKTDSGYKYVVYTGETEVVLYHEHNAIYPTRKSAVWSAKDWLDVQGPNGTHPISRR